MKRRISQLMVVLILMVVLLLPTMPAMASGGCVISGKVILQGGGRLYPAGYQDEMGLSFYPADLDLNKANILTAGPLWSVGFTSEKASINQTERSISFQFLASRGTYQVALYMPYNLINLKKNVDATGATAYLDMGTLINGNSWEDTQIETLDFSILLYDYGAYSPLVYPELPPHPRWNNGRNDFNHDGRVSSIDFSIMQYNFGRSSPQIVP